MDGPGAIALSVVRQRRRDACTVPGTGTGEVLSSRQSASYLQRVEQHQFLGVMKPPPAFELFCFSNAFPEGSSGSEDYSCFSMIRLITAIDSEAI